MGEEEIAASIGACCFAHGRRQTMIRGCRLIAIALLLPVGCTVGPNYKRPPIQTPDAYRGLAPDAAPQTAASIADEKWWTIFDDEQLRALIQKAIGQNCDGRIAAA